MWARVFRKLLLLIMPGHTFIVKDERFEVSEAALGRLGPSCMLQEARDITGSTEESVIAWPAPLTQQGFAHAMQWANTGDLVGVGARDMAECFRAADALNLPTLAGLCLSRGPPPSYFATAPADPSTDPDPDACMNFVAEYVDEVEAQYSLLLGPTTFMERRFKVVDLAQVQIIPQGYLHLFSKLRPQSLSGTRNNAPLFTEPDELRAKVEALLPPEARICLNEGLCIAGGFLARCAAELGGITELQQPDGLGNRVGSCDIDFFVTTGDETEALRIVRRTLIALARHCEAVQCGMVVVRSPYALTIAMDDCAFDLQIVLCTFNSPQEVIGNFDIDACRIAYDGTEFLASETFVRALVSGVILAKPQFDSGNYAKRLEKYATLGGGRGGYTIVIENYDHQNPGRTPSLLKQRWRAVASAAPGRSADCDTVRLERRGQECDDQHEVVHEYERPFGPASLAQAQEWDGRRPFHPDGSLLNRDSRSATPNVPETEEAPTWADASNVAPYENPAPRPRLVQEVKAKQQYAYDDRNARYFVEVWRGQRRRPRAPPSRRLRQEPEHTEPYWRFEASKQKALAMSTGTVSMFDPETLFFSDEEDRHDLNGNFAKDVIFQQLDMHPIYGAWNKHQKAFLASATENEPLVFLDLIEDAARVLPADCRLKLPRCLRVPARADTELFKPTAARQWQG